MADDVDQRPSKVAKTTNSEPEHADEVSQWDTWHTDEGYPYYHNNVTGETVWEEPEALRTHREAEEARREEEEWAEAAKRDEERKARRAARLKAEAERAAAQAAAELDSEAQQAASSSSDGPTMRDLFVERARADILAAVAAFQAALLDHGVRSHSSWESALPRLAVDPRFTALPGMALRRRLFDWWCQRRAADAPVAAEEAAAEHAKAVERARSRWRAELLAAAADRRLLAHGLTFESFRDSAATSDGRASAGVLGDAEAKGLFDAVHGPMVAARSARDAEEAKRQQQAEEAEAAVRRARARVSMRATLQSLPWLRSEVEEAVDEGLKPPRWQGNRLRRRDGSLGPPQAAGDVGAMGSGVLRGREALRATETPTVSSSSSSSSSSLAPPGGRGGVALAAALGGNGRTAAAGDVVQSAVLCRDPLWAKELNEDEMAAEFDGVVEAMTQEASLRIPQQQQQR